MPLRTHALPIPHPPLLLQAGTGWALAAALARAAPGPDGERRIPLADVAEWWAEEVRRRRRRQAPPRTKVRATRRCAPALPWLLAPPAHCLLPPPSQDLADGLVAFATHGGFPGGEVVERHGGALRFRLPATGEPLSSMFR